VEELAGLDYTCRMEQDAAACLFVALSACVGCLCVVRGRESGGGAVIRTTSDWKSARDKTIRCLKAEVRGVATMPS
jgi:hypothetical protein